MPPLTRAADHSKLWFVIAAALAASGKPRAQPRRHPRSRHASGSPACSPTSSPNGCGRGPGRAVPRCRWPAGSGTSRRPTHCRPGIRPAPRRSRSASGWRARRLGLALALLAGLVGLSRVATGAHYPGDVLAGFGIGAGIAVLGGAAGATGRGDETACDRATADRYPTAAGWQRRGAGGQSVIGKRHRCPRHRRGPRSAATGRNRRTRSRRRSRSGVALGRRAGRGARDRRRRRHRVHRRGGCRRGQASAGGIPRRHVQPLRQGHRLRHRRENR